MQYQVPLTSIGFLCGLAVLVAACGTGAGGDSSKLKVVATTTQIGDFAANVGGDRIALTVLLKPNQDAHDFEPEPSQSRALSQADLVLTNGLGLDAFVDKAVAGSKGRVAVVTDGIVPRAEPGEPANGGRSGNHDPHVWLSVANARRMVENTRDALMQADATNASSYRDSASAYLARLDDLETSIRQEITAVPPSCRKLVTNHDVLGYYATAYGLSVVGSVIPSASTEARASAADVAEIVRKVRAESVPAIFAETSANPSLIRQVGREAGVRVVDDLYGDSLGPKGSDAATYVTMMESNTRKIVEALKGCRT